MGTDRVDALGEATTLGDRKRRAGQRMVIGFETAGVTDELRQLVREVQPAGFVLFARNVEEPAQVRELNRELASLVDDHYPALLCVDQEGGRVQRVKSPATVWPPMRVLGNADDPGFTEQCSAAMARELHAVGFNLNFAPVADVDSNPDNPIIGDRSFGRRPEQVSRHLTAFVRGHHAEGMITCAKHFPGHGDTHTDSHLELPVVERDRRDLEHVELPPFATAIQAGVGSIMSAHVVYPAFDEDWPATLSPHVLPRLLRERMGYGGVVFSDDMLMKAVHGRYEVEQQVRMATRASVDVFLVCRHHDVQFEFFRALIHDQELGYDDDAIDATERLMAMRERFLLKRRPQPLLADVGLQLHKDLSRLATERGA